MDLNYLLQREQVERARADRSQCEHSRAAHLGLAEGYRAVIDTHRRRRVAATDLKAELRPQAR